MRLMPSVGRVAVSLRKSIKPVLPLGQLLPLSSACHHALPNQMKRQCCHDEFEYGFDSLLGDFEEKFPADPRAAERCKDEICDQISILTEREANQAENDDLPTVLQRHTNGRRSERHTVVWMSLLDKGRNKRARRTDEDGYKRRSKPP